MEISAKLITVVYYCLVAYISAMLIWNLMKTKEWEREILYIIVLIPFLLRLFHLK